MKEHLMKKIKAEDHSSAFFSAVNQTLDNSVAFLACSLEI